MKRKSNFPSADHKKSALRAARPSLTLFFLACGLFFVIFWPSVSFASVQITEIMYDVSGADTGREWIEVTNTGVSSVDIGEYKFFEADTNHKLVPVAGGVTLAPGGSAIIVDNSTKFKTDWPGYAGLLFDSTFSLSNTGETITIKNKTDSIEDSVSYTSGTGAAGDSGSLHRSGSVFVAALPNPGVFPGEIKSVPIVQKPTPTKTASPAKTKSGNIDASTASTEQPLDFATPETANGSPTSSAPLWGYDLGLMAVIIVGVAATLYARVAQTQEATKSLADEFEIIE